MKYHIITYGCQMNESDREKIAGILQKQGHKPAKSEKQADLIVVNVCSVRQSPVDRVHAKINKYYKTKKIILAGCVLEKDKKALKDKVAEFWHPSQYFGLPALYQKKFSAFVPIMTGCNNFCSYCVVPYTRGREISKPAEDIINEVKLLVKKGYREIVLLGQNVNSYKSKILNPKSETISKFKIQNSKLKYFNFPLLLKLINSIPGDFWLRFITSHPKDMSNELIETMARCKKVCEYVHLPVQSGDNEILKKMNRKYTVAHYKNLIKKIRLSFKKYRPDDLPVAISTDIIIGFPDETKKQFENTAKVMRELKFDMAYIAKYSPRPGTAAAKLKDNVSPAEKKQREKILTDILKKTALEHNKKYLNQTVGVLVDSICVKSVSSNLCLPRRVRPNVGLLQDQSVCLGKTRTSKTVKIVNTPRKTKPGDIIKVKITNATPWGLKSS